MKRIIFLLVLGVIAIASKAQKLQASYNAASYYAYDSTTFFLGVHDDVAFIVVDFTDLNADDAVLSLGGATDDFERAINFTLTSSDTINLDATSYMKTIRRSDGTRYTRAYRGFKYTFSHPSSYMAITIVWNSVTSGRVKLYF